MESGLAVMPGVHPASLLPPNAASSEVRLLAPFLAAPSGSCGLHRTLHPAAVGRRVAASLELRCEQRRVDDLPGPGADGDEPRHDAGGHRGRLHGAGDRGLPPDGGWWPPGAGQNSKCSPLITP